MSAEDVLVNSDPQGHWGWAGFRLTPVLGIEATSQYADLTLNRREEWAADAEAAWLEAQWMSGIRGRFEIRYRNDPAAASPRLSCACLCRIQGSTGEDVVDAARTFRDHLAAALPPHVTAERFTDARDVHAWLVPFGGPEVPSALTEVVKRLSWQATVRQDSGRNATIVVSRYATRRSSWEPGLRKLAALPFPAMLTVGLEAFPRSRSFRAGLEDLADTYQMLAQPARGLPVFSVSTRSDPFAARAALLYGRYAGQYDGPAFRIRISLAGERPLPPDLGAWLAGTLSDDGTDPEVGATAVAPLPQELGQAWANVATLGAGWLADTYRGRLPGSALGDVERELMRLVDLSEARAAVQLPIAWPGHLPLYADLFEDLPVEDDDFGDDDEGTAAGLATGDPVLLRRLRQTSEYSRGEQA
jgi:hypothetical protein